MDIKRQLLVCVGLGLGCSGHVAAGDDQSIYDSKGYLLQSTDEDGLVIYYVRDHDGNLVEVRYGDGQVVNYDKNGKAISTRE